MIVAARDGPCVASNTVSRSPSHQAIVACGSIGLLCSPGVRYILSTRTGAPANAPSGSPASVSVGKFGFTLSGLYSPR